jgi:hypothetical protein
LQSKRLFADEDNPESESAFENRFRRGFSGLFASDDELANLSRSRTFTFSAQSSYKSLAPDNYQYDAVRHYEEQNDIPVYYLLYNPLVLPQSIELPLTGDIIQRPCEVGCRVVPSSHLRQAVDAAGVEKSPSYRDLREKLPVPFTDDANRAGWRLEYFVVDLLLQCKTGRITDIRNDSGLRTAFYRRTRPISAAIGITIDGPQGFDWAIQE